MRKFVLALSIITSVFTTAQEKEGVEKSLTGVQIGILGANIYNEIRLDESLSLRSEVSLYPSIWGGDLYSKTGFALAPAISFSPKWYYNLGKRSNIGKRIKNNSGNYLSTKLEYIPDWFVISNTKDIHVNPTLAIIPNWGLRRNFSENFNYELRLGLGIGKILKEGYDLQVIPEISFRLGYDF
ncbi:hypothetical protein [Chryseobacterium hispalense]|uniref:hypothetical protein n=1 Tax=Chryseobacterium hispalense TaxID=1453492 RepID=UPI00391AC238